MQGTVVRRLLTVATISMLAACARGGRGDLCWENKDCDEDAGLWCEGSGTEGTGTCEDDPLGDFWADCRSDDDCEENLSCVFPPSATPNDEGVCAIPSNTPR